MRIGIYPRKSVYRDNSESIAVQIKMCKDYANIVFADQPLEFRIYDKDEGFSGKNTKRPSFQELMEDVKSNKLDLVMVYRLDRISRNVNEFSEMYEIMHSHNVGFLSIKEAFDTNTSIGRTVMYILSAFSQFERENTSERVTDNMQALGASGKWTGGKLPAGMKSIRKEMGGKEHSYLLVDDEKIKLVKMIYNMFLEGNSITKIERYCRDHGIKSERGKYLSTSQIYCMLSNPVYCSNEMSAYYYFLEKGYTLPDSHLFDGTRGLIGYGRTRQNDKVIANNKWTIGVGIHTPVIPANEWISVQKRFGENKFFRSNKYEIGLLKGVLKCKCGSRMDVRTYSKNDKLFSYYYCATMQRKGKQYCNSGYIRVADIDNAFLDILLQIKSNPEMIRLRKEELSYTDVDILKKELKGIQQSIDNLTNTLMDNIGSTASSYIVKQIENLDKDKRKLESSLVTAEMNNSIAKSDAETKEVIYDYICCLLNNFESLSYQEKNELIKKAVKTCTYDNGNMHIIF